MRVRRLFGCASVLMMTLPAAMSAQTAQVNVEAAVARAIEDRMPVDTASVFGADVGTVWLWSRISGADGQTISHVWRHGEKEWPITLSVNGSPWRTFSSKVIPPEWTGEWSVEVRDESGKVLKRLRFTVRG